MSRSRSREQWRQGLNWALLVAALLTASLALAACDSGSSQPSEPQGSPAAERGQVVVMNYCNACHPGGGQGAGPSLRDSVPRYTDEQLRSVVRNGTMPMPAFNTSVITEDQLGDLIAYLRTSVGSR